MTSSTEASRAAHAAGLSPAVIHGEPGLLVLEFIAARTLGEDDEVGGDVVEAEGHDFWLLLGW
jgi:hypothetical protein